MELKSFSKYPLFLAGRPVAFHLTTGLPFSKLGVVISTVDLIGFWAILLVAWTLEPLGRSSFLVVIVVLAGIMMAIINTDASPVVIATGVTQGAGVVLALWLLTRWPVRVFSKFLKG